jgi:YVTN family beta-propeller protein
MQVAVRGLQALGVIAVMLVGVLVINNMALGQTSSAPAGSGPFRTIADVPLSGGTSRFDYQSYDPRTQRLYIAHLGASLVTVFDTQTGAVVGDVHGVKGVHGLVVVPDLGRVYASATGANQVAVIDPQSLAVLTTIPGGDYPDGLDYDPDLGKLYVSDEHGGTDTVIDVQANLPVATIPLGGDAGNTRFDPVSRLMYVGVHGVNQLVTIDPSSDQVSERLDLPGCDDPHGVALNPARRTAFVACEGNATLLVVDLQTMQVGASFPVGRTPDVLAFDADLSRLYVAAESGPLTAFVQDAGVRPLAQGDVGPNAHSVAVNPVTHHLYLPLQNLGGRAVLREVMLDAPTGG